MRQARQIPQKWDGSEFQTDGTRKLNERSPTDFRFRFSSFTSFFLLMIAGNDMFGTYRGKPKGNVVENIQNDGR